MTTTLCLVRAARGPSGCLSCTVSTCAGKALLRSGSVTEQQTAGAVQLGAMTAAAAEPAADQKVTSPVAGCACVIPQHACPAMLDVCSLSCDCLVIHMLVAWFYFYQSQACGLCVGMCAQATARGPWARHRHRTPLRLGLCRRQMHPRLRPGALSDPPHCAE